VPLRLVARLSQQGRPDLDLSGLRLTRLGIDCNDADNLFLSDYDSPPGCLWLWPERLPGTLEELHLLGLNRDWLGHLAWAAQPSAGLAGPPLTINMHTPDARWIAAHINMGAGACTVTHSEQRHMQIWTPP